MSVDPSDELKDSVEIISVAYQHRSHHSNSNEDSIFFTEDYDRIIQANSTNLEENDNDEDDDEDDSISTLLKTSEIRCRVGNDIYCYRENGFCLLNIN